MGKRSVRMHTSEHRCPGEETREPVHRPVGESDRASEVWLALVVVALFVQALCFLTAVWVTALRGLPGW